MANRKRNFDSGQADFFQQLDEPALASKTAPDLGIGPELMGAINTAIRHARAELGIKREGIVERMNACLPEDDRITLRQLYSWTAASKEFHEFPFKYVAAFCWATQCDLPARVFVASIGFGLVDADEIAAKKLGENLIAQARLRRENRELSARLDRKS